VITRLAFGCEQLGGYEWGQVDPVQIGAAIEVAVARGVTLFDTADCYARGESERRLGRLLAPHRERVVLATKFGVRFDSEGKVFYDSTPAWAERALDESLGRLGTESVDLLQMHYWDGITPLAALFERLEKLRERGKIGWYGITNHVPAESLPSGYPGLVSASLEFSLAAPAHGSAARRFAAAGLTFIGYGTLGQGILSGKYGSAVRFGADDRRSRKQYRHFHGAGLQRNEAIVEVLNEHAATLGATPSQLAIAWVLQALPQSVALVGFKRTEQLLDALAALQLRLPEQTRIALEQAAAPADA
jgi:aryl-alcohol dehydrogenase-like predicted oxidoreductase